MFAMKVTLIWYLFTNILAEGSKPFNPLDYKDSSCYNHITVYDEGNEPDGIDDDYTNEFYSPGNDNGYAYPNNLQCLWHFVGVNATAKWRLDLTFFDVEASKGCVYDYVKIFKQSYGQQWYDQTEFLCGSVAPFKRVYATQSIFILLKADETKSKLGFNGTIDIRYPKDEPMITCFSSTGDKSCLRTVKAVTDGSVSLKCIASGDPQPIFEWRIWNNGTASKIPDAIFESETFEGDLVLHDLRLSDNGIYIQCKAKNKHGHDEQVLKLVVEESCSCPRHIDMSWFDYPPYTPYMTGYYKWHTLIIDGIFYDSFQKMIDQVCQKCRKASAKTSVDWNRQTNVLKTISEFYTQVNSNNFSVAFPVLLHKDAEWDKFQNYFFLPMVPHPGYFYLVKEVPGDSQAIFNALSHCLVVFIIFILMIALAGIVIWFLETYFNEEEFPHTFIEGIKRGIWWAYITATTVGYGDIAPRGVPGRVFAIVWMFGGLIIFAIVMGEIMTSLMLAMLETKTRIPLQAKIGVINETETHNFAVRSTMAEVQTYQTYSALAEAVKSGALDGCLVDQYVAGFHHQLYELKAQSTLQNEDKMFGVLFNEGVIDGSTYSKLKMYLTEQQHVVADAIQKNEQIFPTTEKRNIVDKDNPLYQRSLISLLAILLIATIIGLAYDYAYSKPKKRKLMEMLEYSMIEEKDLSHRADELKKVKSSTQYGLKSCHEELANRFDLIMEKHAEQQHMYKALEEIKAKRSITKKQDYGFDQTEV